MFRVVKHQVLRKLKQTVLAYTRTFCLTQKGQIKRLDTSIHTHKYRLKLVYKLIFCCFLHVLRLDRCPVETFPTLQIRAVKHAARPEC